jgi:hypothetical protein
MANHEFSGLHLVGTLGTINSDDDDVDLESFVMGLSMSRMSDGVLRHNMGYIDEKGCQ